MKVFSDYSDYISRTEFPANLKKLPKELLVAQDGNLEAYYAPFEYVNIDAKISICGITPGLTQALLALNEAGRLLRKGSSEVEALKGAKNTASFGGAMRASLIRMLDKVGIHEVLGLNGCLELFESRADLVHYTSVLKNPIFISGKNYNGTPKIQKNKFLSEQLDSYFSAELPKFRNDMIFFPLGPVATDALYVLAERGIIDRKKILNGLPHPSGANQERINYFLQEKPANQLSSKTNAEKIDNSRSELIGKVAQLAT